MSNRTQGSKSKVILLALILLVPGFLYIAVNRLGSNQYVSLPVFGEKKLSGEMKRNWGREYPDTIFHTLADLQLVNYNNAKISFPGPDTTISIVHLFFTKDSAFSKLMMENVQALATRFQDNPRIGFYSISVDPAETDASIQQFLKPFKGFEKLHWKIGYQPSADIFDYAKHNLLIDAMVDPADAARFLISNQLVLVDSRKRIRGFYDVSQKGEVDRLEDEVKLLVVEEIRNRPAKIEQQ
ncbi:SCO family protein [Sphingobacterium oryzagri]|uniref:SCO family protein n=1 Tax=Sphingobacterium oryzagri TaxID=3025669 RepID=A0ABY7WHT4_9SPHI|nr:SCO family protein [Sphingobacterium sp. KACC 22765]WDF68169.1 SCO family protein [Sphingobacterium sp. KACC 22765]